ncbi:hypothetical protein [Bacillus cereus]|uniref:hypothetical protein n=1 Tax=Bacillus cereus TaxID=1396 RepID=UPI0015CF2803|nr:hypothetical protein [Bacillus cereus]
MGETITIPINEYYKLTMIEDLLKEMEKNGLTEMDIYKKANIEIFGCGMEDNNEECDSY